MLLHIVPIGPSLGRVPGPDLARVQGVQPALDRPGGKIEQITDEVPVDVVRTLDEDRFPELRECELVVPRWEQTILGKRGASCHMYYVMDNIYVNARGGGSIT